MRLKNKLLTVGCVALAAATLASGVACNEHELAPFAKSLSSGQKQTQSSGSARNVDILFVIDDSNSMTEEQQGLDQNFQVFLKKLLSANANYRLAAVSTSSAASNQKFVTNALEKGGDAVLKVSADELSKVKAACKEYFGDDKAWLESDDFKSIADDDERLKKVQDLFRCQAIMGVGGDGIEKGLETMMNALANYPTFKRPGSIMTVVFVTDENDCSSPGSLSIDGCEVERNIEDSCRVTQSDIVETSSVGTGADGQAVLNSILKVSPGASMEVKGVKRTLRDVCVAGDEASRQALMDCVEKGSEECPAADFINCPEGGCKNKLEPRSTFYDFLLDYVIRSNQSEYEKQNKTAFAAVKDATERKNLLRELAQSDIIIANIINRDQGQRYNTKIGENWCGTAGTQSYRYQLFAEMFGNNPIYAPICCKNERFAVSSTTKVDNKPVLVSEDVCNGQMGSDIGNNGNNGYFGPVLGAIGQRIGEAINTICADSVPVTCNPKACADKSSSCPCLFGCNEKNPHLANTANEYFLCNEFDFKVGVVPSSNKAGDMTGYKEFVKDADYNIDFDSNYCRTRTGSPIQINLLTSEPNTNLVFDYPKQVSGAK